MSGQIDLKAIEAGMKLYRHEAAARQTVDMCVAHALNEIGEPHDFDFRRVAHDVAALATTTLLQHIYVEDAEIRRLRDERDHYKAMAERLINITPPSFTVQSICEPSEVKKCPPRFKWWLQPLSICYMETAENCGRGERIRTSGPCLPNAFPLASWKGSFMVSLGNGIAPEPIHCGTKVR
jgi:hypothetical protein